MATKFTNKIGLEAEVFVTNKKGELVRADAHALPADNFPMLGEIRGEPGETAVETVANFLKAYYSFVEKAEAKGLTVDLRGCAEISHAHYTAAMKAMGSKEWPECKNVYGTDISDQADHVVDPQTGKIVSHYISAGLHIHFSSNVTHSIEIPKEKYTYTEVTLPLVFGDKDKGATANLTLYKRSETGGTQAFWTSTASVNRVTRPVVESIVKALDVALFTQFFPIKDNPIKTKYRQPGFYEDNKPHGGFEYRSLPFTQDVMNNLMTITKQSFKLLAEL